MKYLGYMVMGSINISICGPLTFTSKLQAFEGHILFTAVVDENREAINL